MSGETEPASHTEIRILPTELLTRSLGALDAVAEREAATQQAIVYLARRLAEVTRDPPTVDQVAKAKIRGA